MHEALPPADPSTPEAPRDEPADAAAIAPPSALRLAGATWVARGDVAWNFSRSGGPGGQNVNKLSTRAELRVRVEAIRGLDGAALDRLRRAAGSRVTADGLLLLVSDETRSQQENKALCIERLREIVARALVVPRRRRKTKPTKGSKERRLTEKRIRSERKRNRGSLD